MTGDYHDPRVAGALFDFLGYLTTREKVIEVGASAVCPPVVEALREWADLRGLDLDDADVMNWQHPRCPVV